MALQQFGFLKSQYERPTQDWVCGWTAEGWTCQVGPDKNGQCLATAECQPLRKGDRWDCSRPDLYGGKCPEGSAPDGSCSKPIPRCQPIRSLRAKRGVVSLWVSAFTLGGLILIISGPQGPAFISPGDLSVNHGAIAQNCETCHNAIHGGTVDWFGAIFASGIGRQDSKLCLNCHDLGEHTFEAHGRSSEDLVAVTARLETTPSPPNIPFLLTISEWVQEKPHLRESRLACASCHHEHQGRKLNLADIRDQSCQSCHTMKFLSLDKGHPEYSNYPYERRTRIAFDHISHIGKYFRDGPKELAPTTCTVCHMPDQKGRTMLTGNFEKTCAGCHAVQIEGKGRAGSKGISFLRLPGLDLEVLEEHDIAVGQWPADYNIEEGLTPFMKLLLAGEKPLADNLALLADFDDFTDLSDASKEELEAVAEIIWGVKELFFDLIYNGQQAYISRLTAAIGPEFTAGQVTSLVGQLPVEVIQGAQKEWLPILMSEVSHHRTGMIILTTQGSASDIDLSMDQDREKMVMAGGWYRQDSDFSILYRPTKHADEFIRAWIEFRASQSEGTTVTSSTREIFSTLSAPKAPGVCMKCHSVDIQEGNQSIQINWFSSRPMPNMQNFTTFSHEPHFSVLGEKGCRTCHALESEADVMAGYEDGNPLTFASSFTPFKKSVCVTCHISNKAPDSCLTCHNYHVGKIVSVLPVAEINPSISVR